jgi:hypothetical protein
MNVWRVEHLHAAPCALSLKGSELGIMHLLPCMLPISGLKRIVTPSGKSKRHEGCDQATPTAAPAKSSGAMSMSTVTHPLHHACRDADARLRARSSPRGARPGAQAAALRVRCEAKDAAPDALHFTSVVDTAVYTRWPRLGLGSRRTAVQAPRPTSECVTASPPGCAGFKPGRAAWGPGRAAL